MRRIGIPLVVILVASLLTPALVDVTDPWLARLLFAVLCLVAIMTFGIFWKREERMPLLCDPFFLLCFFLAQFYVVGPIALKISGFVAGAEMFFTPVAPQRAMDAMIGAIVVVGAAVLAYKSRLGDMVAERMPTFESTRRRLGGQWIEAFLVIGGVIGCLAWIQFEGGLARRLSTGYGSFMPGGAVFRIAHLGLLVGTLIMWWRVVATPGRQILRRTLFASLIVFEALFFGIVYGVRKYLFFLFFGLLAVYLLRKGFKALPKLRVAAAAAMILVFFSVWGTIRSKPLTMLVGAEYDPRIAPSRELYTGYLNSVSGPFSVACLVWEVFPEVEPFRYGKTLQVTLFGFIPRAIWPDKPIGIGKELTRYVTGPYYHRTSHSIAPTIPADFYLNFGWIGLVVGGALMGVVCRAVTCYAVRGMKDGRQTTAARVLIPSAFVMLLGEVRADMATFIWFYTLSFVPLLASLALFRLDVEGVDKPAF
jgi:hypothetical protein